MEETYDLLILLTGENKTDFPRSKRAIELYRQGRFGDVLVSGSAGGFSPFIPTPERGEHVDVANFLNLRGRIPAPRIYTDWRPFDTLGNFVFPYAEPLEGNPDPRELRTLHLTEQGHRERTLDCAARVVQPLQLDDFEFSDGDYNPQGIQKAVTSLWHYGLMKATRRITASPEEAMRFLEEEHPFYQQDWFRRPLRRRQAEVLLTSLAWAVQ